MSKLNICIIGGTGFVGHSITDRLVDQGHRVKILTRSRELHRAMLVLPTVNLVEGDIYDQSFLNQEFTGMDVVINLVGILNQFRGKPTFEMAHAILPAYVADACKNQNVPRLLHMSALKASNGGPSEYLRTKGTGEDRVHQMAGQKVNVTSFRPSVIFGPRDSFTNRFAHLIALAPGVLPLACPNARFQPIYVEDVAKAFVQSIGNYHTYGKRYELCGPGVYTLRELVEYIAKVTRKRCYVIPLSDGLSRMQAMVGEILPGKPISLDNYRSMREDSCCKGGFPEEFDFTLTELEAVVPHYLGHERREHPRRPGS
jgi:uncharacterized protein YbjT (DUF2867 family)